MLLDVRNALKNPGQSYPLSRSLELPALDVLDEVIRFGDVRLEGEFVGAVESVKLTGRASCTVHAHCAKCLEPVSERLTAPVDEQFVKTENPEDPDARPLTGYELDLADVVQQALLLELPLRFLCSADCKGLCHECGINLNKQRCTCQEGSQRPFSALSGLLSDDEEV